MTLLVLCGALFLDALDVSMKGVALPSIGADLHMSTGALQWVVSAYVLGFGGFLLLGGRCADLFGRRRTFIVSLAGFVVASGLGGLAGDGPLLVAARFLTGVGAAFTAPAGLALITTSFAEGPARNRALSIYSATGASGFALGLVVGGVLTEVSWRWVFFVPVLMATLILLGATRLPPEATGPDRGRRLDLPGTLSFTAAMLLLVDGLAQPTRRWELAGAAVLLAGFVLIEHRAADPVVPPKLFRSWSLLRANVAAMALLGGWIGALFGLTLFLQQERGWSPLQTGLAVCPTGVVVALLAPRIAAPLVARFGITPVVLAGLISATAAYALLLPIGPHTVYLLGMLPSFLLVGLAFALTYGPVTMAAAQSVPADRQGVAAGLVNTSFQLGPALVLAVVATTGTFVVPLLVSVLGAAVAASGLLPSKGEVRGPAPVR